MSLRNELIRQLLVIVNADFDYDSDRMSARRLHEAELVGLESRDLPHSLRSWCGVDFAGLACKGRDATLSSCRLARADDAQVSMLVDFYQRAYLSSPTAAEAASYQGTPIVRMIEERATQDLELIAALADGGEVVLANPTFEGTEYFGLAGQPALAKLVWNNLVGTYTSLGMGYINPPLTDEERLASSIIDMDHESLFLLFTKRALVLQIDAGTSLLLHALDDKVLQDVRDILPEALGLCVFPLQ